MPSGAEHGQIGRFTIVRPLGAGGMGEVYLVHDPELRRQVALKIIAKARAGDEETVRRMLHEARAAAGIDHAGVCTIHEAGTLPDGRPFIVMQYVPGESLHARLAGGALPLRTAFGIAKQIAEALAAAHALGVVHRDLKPSNVMIAPDGRVKVVDFGIASLPLTAAGADDRTTAGPPDFGAVVGTAGYMSPEQVQGRPIDGRSDLFALGALLFECATGRPAFTGSNWIEVNARVLHVDPPPLSSVVAEATAGHDTVCARLLAKEAGDRFASAQEATGALEVAAGPQPVPVPVPVPPPMRWSRGAITAIAGTALVVSGLAVTAWRHRTTDLPAPPPAAATWFARGTEQIREGAYQSATRALSQAIELFPDYVLAHARMAEARAELDDWSAAKDSLLRVASLVPDESRLPADARMRLAAVRSLVTRDVDGAVARYRDLVAAHPSEADVHLDLGRAQEDAGRRTEARAAYEKAVALDPQSAAAHLRLGSVLALEASRDEALSSYDRAQALYEAASDVEGVAEVRLARGTLFDASGDLVRARAEIDQAKALAMQAGATSLALRAQLAQSVVSASEGRLKESETLASDAVRDATAQGLETVAAEGLTDLAATLLESGRAAEAEQEASQAVVLASRRNASRTAANARTQLASIQLTAGRPTDALATVADPLAFAKAHHYHRLELSALGIAARAHQDLDGLDLARTLASEALTMAESLEDDAETAVAASSLASAETALGNLPAAEALRTRALEIHRRQRSQGYLPYDLANHADVLIRLGRVDEAERDLDELGAGIAAGVESYVGRGRRLSYGRAMAEVTSGRCSAALPRLRELMASGSHDTAGLMAPSLLAYCSARPGSSTLPAAPSAGEDPVVAREESYWRASTWLIARDWPAALAEARRGLTLLGSHANHELRWRLAAVGAAAAGALHQEEAVRSLRDTARESFDLVRSVWGPSGVNYDGRRDLLELTAVGLSTTPVRR